MLEGGDVYIVISYVAAYLGILTYGLRLLRRLRAHRDARPVDRDAVVADLPKEL